MFKKNQFMCNDGYGDYDYESGSHMFLKIADFGKFAICVQSNSAPKNPPFVKLIKSVYKNGRGSSKVSCHDLYVMLDDMAMSYGRYATQREVQMIGDTIRANIGNIQFTYIMRTDDGYEYGQFPKQATLAQLTKVVKGTLNVTA